MAYVKHIEVFVRFDWEADTTYKQLLTGYLTKLLCLLMRSRAVLDSLKMTPVGGDPIKMVFTGMKVQTNSLVSYSSGL